VTAVQAQSEAQSSSGSSDLVQVAGREGESAVPHARVEYAIVGKARPTMQPLPTENVASLTSRAPRALPTSNEQLPSVEPRPVVLNVKYTPTTFFEERQQWEGTVQEVRSDGIVVTLIDLTDQKNSAESAEISWDEVPDADHALVIPGAVFYWSIGYERTIHGQKSNISSIRFRRLPKKWTRAELEAARREAEEMERLLGSSAEHSDAAR
jgi:hypothetical protein